MCRAFARANSSVSNKARVSTGFAKNPWFLFPMDWATPLTKVWARSDRRRYPYGLPGFQCESWFGIPVWNF